MSKLFSVLVIVLSLVAGFGGGWVYQLTLGKASSTQISSPTNSIKSTTDAAKNTSSTTSSTTTLKDCLTDVWGADKYAAISANSSLATTEDNLASLKCYKD